MSAPYNFAAGPATMPVPVLERIRHELPRGNPHGFSVMELPFTGAAFKRIAADAVQDLRDLLDLPEDYTVLFMHGGAMAQLSLVPLNLLRGRTTADYADTGYWSGRAIREARRYCRVQITASAARSGFTRLPLPDEWRVNPRAAYCHITANETVNGIEFHEPPETGGVTLVADMTSNFLSRPIDVSRYGLIYASAQKNIGPSGLAIVVLRQDLAGGAHRATPAVFDYETQTANGSMYNTPPTFSIYVAGLVFQWIKANGGLAAMAEAAGRKSGKLYRAIDSSDFYRCAVEPQDRSRMNVCFRLAAEELEPVFLEEAEAAGLVNLKGHKAAGGIRASLYNAMPESGVDALVAFMRDFEARRG